MPKMRCGFCELDGDLVLFGIFLADPNDSAFYFLYPVREYLGAETTY